MTLAKPRAGLGRGLGDLIHRTDPDLEPQRSEPLAVEPPEGSYYAELPVESIRPNPKQPRQVFDADALAELVESIRDALLALRAEGMPMLVAEQNRILADRADRALTLVSGRVAG